MRKNGLVSILSAPEIILIVVATCCLFVLLITRISLGIFADEDAVRSPPSFQVYEFYLDPGNTNAGRVVIAKVRLHNIGRFVRVQQKLSIAYSFESDVERRGRQSPSEAEASLYEQLRSEIRKYAPDFVPAIPRQPISQSQIAGKIDGKNKFIDGTLVILSRSQIWCVVACLLCATVVVFSKIHDAATKRRRLRENRCRECGYSLKGLGRSPHCPECGYSFDAQMKSLN